MGIRNVIRFSSIIAFSQLVFCASFAIFHEASNSSSATRYTNLFGAGIFRDPLTGRSSECAAGRFRRSSYVCDTSAFLSSRSINRIDKEIQMMYEADNRKYSKAYCQRTEMKKGYLFEVVLVRSVSSESGGIKGFADKLFHKWRVGQPEICGNGILLAISMEQRQYYFAVGHTVAQLMTSPRKDSIEKILLQYLRRRNLYLAILKTVQKTGKELKKANSGGSSWASAPNSDPVPQNKPIPQLSSPTGNDSAPSPWTTLLALIALVSGISLIFAFMNGEGGKAASERKKLKRKNSDSNSIQKSSTNTENI